ncbi:hypothetical protein [Prevotella dentasini]|uniref:hypothetical protein n=1 Tax=Prevotella dentasini TaxID=589537 RepID=UPI00046A0D2E|nr:hypothetical protein [Prevotella dentasini]
MPKTLIEHIKTAIRACYENPFKVSLSVLLASIALCALLLFAIPEEDHLRWGLGYLAVWAMLLSPVAVFVSARHSEWRVMARVCSAFFFLAVWGGCILLTAIGGDILLPPTYFCDDGDYLVRQQYDGFFNPPVIAVYKREGLLEHRVSKLRMANADSIKVYEQWDAIVVYSSGLKNADPWGDSWGSPERAIYPLTDNGAFVRHRREVKALARKLRVHAIDLEYE